MLSLTLILISLLFFSIKASVPFNLIAVPADGTFQPTVGKATTLLWTNPSNGTVIIYLASEYSNTNVTGHFPASDLSATFIVPPSNLVWTYWFYIQNDENLDQGSLSTSFKIVDHDAPANSQLSTSSKTATSSATATSTPATSSAPANQRQPAALAPSAIAAIAVSSASGFLLICVGAFLLFRCVRRRKQQSKSLRFSQFSGTNHSLQSARLSPLDKVELQAYSVARPRLERFELSTGGLREYSATVHVRPGVHELPGVG